MTLYLKMVRRRGRVSSPDMGRALRSFLVGSCLLGLLAFMGLGCSREPEPSATTGASTAGTTAGGTDNLALNGSKAETTPFLSATDMAEKADIALYPGAHVPDGKSNIRSASGTTRYEIKMVTDDSVEKVVKYYEGKLVKAERMTEAGNVMGMTPKGYFAGITAVSSGGKTEITAVVNVEKG